jgi:ligand-binding sensor domain-containing protein
MRCGDVAKKVHLRLARQGDWLDATCDAAGDNRQLPIKTYTTADGLARDQINRIVRDSRGFLWFCAHEGLLRFDGYTFTNYTVDHGLPHRSIRDLLETRHGIYWIAMTDGLCQFNSTGRPWIVDRQTNHESLNLCSPSTIRAQVLRARSITALHEDRAGVV